MYSFNIGVCYYEYEDVVSLRKNAYSQLKNEGDSLPLFKDGEPYGRVHLLDDGVWIFTLSDKEYRKVRKNGAVLS